MLDVVDQSLDATLDVGRDALLHFLGLQAVVGPDETNDRNVDVGKNVSGCAQQHNRRQQKDYQRHHDKCVWSRQRKSNNPHKVLLHSLTSAQRSVMHERMPTDSHVAILVRFAMAFLWVRSP